MNGCQTFRTVLLMFFLGVASVAAYLFYEHQLYFCLFFSIGGIIGIIFYVVYALNQTVNKVERMVEAIRYNDFSLSFSTKNKSKMERKLTEDINEVIASFRSQLTKKEKQYQYYETLLQIVDSCLLVINKQGHVLWMNRAAEEELCGHRIHQLEELDLLNQHFSQVIKSLHPGEVKVIRIYKSELMQNMAVTVTEYFTPETDLWLVNLRNIRTVLEETEMEAWQKLVRVLTHEIMNSIAPIISLSDTLGERAMKNGINEKDYGIMLQGMQTIHRRSKGLLEFVENYRKLSKLSSPILAPVKVGDLLGDIKKLFPSSDIIYKYEVENKEQTLMIDRSQIEQVLINLLKNASEACMEQEHPEVIIRTFYQADRQIFQLSVTDNGSGILPEVQDKIFIPFFTTKTTGSGIGLSLCKQIMTLHGGSIRVMSEVGKGSCFTLKLLGKE